MSCTLYKNPVLVPAAFLLVGCSIGVFSMREPDAAIQIAGPDMTQAVKPIANGRHMTHEKMLREMSIELSKLQARADRLDSLGQQWVDQAGLQKAGFDFGEDPARGGPGPGEGTDRFELPSFSMVGEDLAAMKQQYDLLEKQLRILDHWEEVADDLPHGIPYASPGGRYQTSRFGTRYDPFGRGRRFHSGIDLAARVGDPVMAMASGKVVFSGWKGGYGKMVEIDHGRGYRTRYAHNSRLTVDVGQRVDTGVVIAKAGSTGRSTGAHLHIEVLSSGRQVDPRPFLERGRRVAAEQRKILAKLAKLEAPVKPGNSQG